MKTLRDNGVKAMLSNSSTPLTVETYSGLRQVAISAPRMVSAKSSGRGRIDELIIMNY
jgi:DNA adenine methylase